jgi:hypothetical protein
MQRPNLFLKTLTPVKPQKRRYHENRETSFSKGFKEGYSKGYYKVRGILNHLAVAKPAWGFIGNRFELMQFFGLR